MMPAKRLCFKTLFEIEAIEKKTVRKEKLKLECGAFIYPSLENALSKKEKLWMNDLKNKIIKG